MARRMAQKAFREQQFADRYAPHIAPINLYVDELRRQGRGWVPYVAPIHGGVHARVLSILRDPGPGTHELGGSGFICVENDDGSAALQAEMLEAVGLTANDLLPWNAYFWYINRAPRVAELEAGVDTIMPLLDLAPNVRVVLLQGMHAGNAWTRLLRRHPDLEKERDLTIVTSFHPSPQALFVRDLGERDRRRARRPAAFREVAELLVKDRGPRI